MQGRSERGGAAPRERARTQQCASATPPDCAGARGADAQKGLIVNSTDLCQGKHRATVNLGAHNGRSDTLHPALQSKCKKKHKKAKRHKRKVRR